VKLFLYGIKLIENTLITHIKINSTENVVNPLLALLLLFSIISTASAELNLILAETEIHSSSGIANPSPSRYSEGFSTPDGEYTEYLEEDPESGELAPPTTTVPMSPSRSKVITRTTTRPSVKNSQPTDVDIAPVVVPIYPVNGHHGSPRH
jgi:hypothetical protein